MTMEQMTDAFKTLMQQQATLNEMISDKVKAQAQAITSQGGGGGVKGKPWHDLELYRNVKPFTGEQKEWEEYNGKLRGHIAAHNAVAAEVFGLHGIQDVGGRVGVGHSDGGGRR